MASSCYVVNRDKGMFGEDAEVFRPERYLDGEWADRVEKGEMTFGYGRRRCLGKDQSGFLLGKIVFEVSCLFVCPSNLRFLLVWVNG